MHHCPRAVRYIFPILFFLFALDAAGAQLNHRAEKAIARQIDSFGEAVVLVELGGQDREKLSAPGLTDKGRVALVASLQSKLTDSLSAADRKRIVQRFRYVPGMVMRVDAAALERLRGNGAVRSIAENGMRFASLAESGRLVFAGQNTSSYDGGDDWAVAVLDTGVDSSHPFLAPAGRRKVVAEACYSGGGFGGQYAEVDSLCPGESFASTLAGSGRHCSGYEGCDHGTHVAGIAAGSGAGFSGVAKGAKIIAVQVFTGIRDLYGQNLCGTGPFQNCIAAFDVDILNGLERVYALRERYDIAAVNMSLGGGSFTASCDGEVPLITAAVRALRQAGIATVVASGNEYQSSAISFPACIGSAVAVGATYDAGPLVDRATDYGNQSPWVDLYAPGSVILSSVPGGGYGLKQGTSMAAPHVAGAWAVLKDARPQGSVDMFEALLGTVGPEVAARSGLFVRRRLDLQAALDSLRIDMAPINSLLLQGDR